MSSTDRSTERRLRRFWRRKVQPATARMRGRGVTFLDVAPAEDMDSWYAAVDPAEATLVEIQSTEVATVLTELWRRQGLPELEAIAPDLAALAARILVVSDRGGRELSDDVYAMY